MLRIGALKITLPSGTYERFKRLTADGVLVPFTAPAKCPSTTVDVFVAVGELVSQSLGRITGEHDALVWAMCKGAGPVKECIINLLHAARGSGVRGGRAG